MMEISAKCPDCRRDLKLTVSEQNISPLTRIRKEILLSHQQKGECQTDPFIPPKVLKFVVKDESTAKSVAACLVENTRWFSLEPEPFGSFLLQTRPEALPLLQNSFGVKPWQRQRV